MSYESNTHSVIRITVPFTFILVHIPRMRVFGLLERRLNSLSMFVIVLFRLTLFVVSRPYFFKNSFDSSSNLQVPLPS